MMHRRDFLAASGAVSLSAAPAARRPNVLIVLLDDFGIGHCTPYSEGLKPEVLDPAYRAYLKSKKVPYEPEEALELSRRAMPVLNSLAKKGVVFNKAFSPSNLCAPSRAGIFTGQNPNRFGVYENIDFEKTGLPKGSMLVERMQKTGYATAMIGKYHTGSRNLELRQKVWAKYGLSNPGGLAKLPTEQRLAAEKELRETGFEGSVIDAHHPLKYGFDYYFGYNHHQCPFYDSEQIWENRNYTGKQPEYNTHLFTNKAITFAKQARSLGKPFCIELALHAMHGPLKPQAPDPYFRPFASQSFELQNFYGHVNAVDGAIARFRDAVGPEEWNNTLFVFIGDNGAPVFLGTPPPGNGAHRGHKGSYFLGGIRVPMIVHWPAGIEKAQRLDALVSTLDVMPTALEAAGLAVPEVDGKSVLPLARGKAKKTREHLMLSGLHARAWGYTVETTIGWPENQRRHEAPGAWVVTDGDYLLRFTGRLVPGLFRDAMDGVPAHYELYDLREDPGETRDLTQQLPGVVERLKKKYEAQAPSWPAPANWRRDRWAELMPGRAVQ
ncbi:MAG: hypothetical protein FJW36_25925 [Acidobacteria bacterium]|nr:hypothetical protein [Acidobacteriota bacterium]